MGYGTVNLGYPIKKDEFEKAGAAAEAVASHNVDQFAHPDIRASMVTAMVQVSYNGG